MAIEQPPQDDLSVGDGVMPGQEKIGFYGISDDEYQCDDESQRYARAAGDMAFVRVMEFENGSNLIKALEEESPDDYLTGGGISRLDWSDVVVRSLLGVGSFACVCKVRVPKFDSDDENSEDGENHPLSSGGSKSVDGDDFEVKTEASSSHDCTTTNRTGSTSSTDGGPVFYALKCLNQRTVSCERTFVEGAADLASEALLLSHLRHDNIVRLHAVFNGCVSEAWQKPGGYFLLMEFLRGTVGDLLRLWREDLKDDIKADKIPSVHERLSGMALGVARGMEYLHKNKVMLRDLKPSNVGFDRDGNVRLFDFGLAREVTTTSDSIIQGVAGSYRYMAPEVALGNGCGFPSDVYSFGVVLWELVTLEKPYAKIKNADEFKQKVSKQGLRPSCNGIHRASLKELIKECWDSQPTIRPRFSDICKTLESEIASLQECSEEPVTRRKPSWHKQAKTLKAQVSRQWKDYRMSMQSKRGGAQ